MVQRQKEKKLKVNDSEKIAYSVKRGFHPTQALRGLVAYRVRTLDS